MVFNAWGKNKEDSPVVVVFLPIAVEAKIGSMCTNNYWSEILQDYKKQAEMYGATVTDEFGRLIAHGIPEAPTVESVPALVTPMAQPIPAPSRKLNIPDGTLVMP
jgi:hypothetical protein